jgi:septum formation protein
MPKIILATNSPHRIEAFRVLGLEFEAVESKIEENFLGRPDKPQELVSELAKRKAEAVAQRYSDGIVIGFDSVGWFQNKILEKPKNHEEAYERLMIISGKELQFFTGICIIDLKNGDKRERVSITEARLRNIRTWEIEKYLDEDPDFKTYALGFDPLNHFSAGFISKINGSYNNILRGMPLELISEMLDNKRRNT